MRWLITFAALAVEVAVVAAQTGNNVLVPAMTKTNPEPCAVVSSHAVSYMAANPRGYLNSNQMSINTSTELAYSYSRSSQTIRSLCLPTKRAIRPKQRHQTSSMDSGSHSISKYTCLPQKTSTRLPSPRC